MLWYAGIDFVAGLEVGYGAPDCCDYAGEVPAHFVGESVVESVS